MKEHIYRKVMKKEALKKKRKFGRRTFENDNEEKDFEKSQKHMTENSKDQKNHMLPLIKEKCQWQQANGGKNSKNFKLGKDDCGRVEWKEKGWKRWDFSQPVKHYDITGQMTRALKTHNRLSEVQRMEMSEKEVGEKGVSGRKKEIKRK